MWRLGLLLVVAACFSKPGLSQRDGGGDDAPSDGGLDVPDDGAMPQGYARIAAGYFHACGISSAGALYCWGRNDYGQLGERADAMTDGATGTPGPVSATITGWTDVAGSRYHTCGIANDKAYCWGRNDGHQSDPQDTSGNDVPVREIALGLTGGEVPVKVFTGSMTSCVITSQQRALCWGVLDVGVNSTTRPVTPLVAGATSTWLDLAVETSHACALSTANHVYCWGSNQRLALGVANPSGPTHLTRTFAEVAQRDATPFTSLSAGNQNVCGTTMTGDLVCWGGYGTQILGDEVADSPGVTIVAGGPVVDVAVGFDHACLMRGSDVHCYGANTDGAIGDGAFASRPMVPSQPVATNVAEIVAGESFSCARSTTNDVTCCGSNRHGELGLGTVTSKITEPGEAMLGLASGEVVLQLVAGDHHTCAIVGMQGMPGRALCWGRNDSRQATNSTNAFEERPVAPAVAGGTTFRMLAAGQAHTCGITSDGGIACWGSNSARQLGNAGTGAAPILTARKENEDFVFIAAGSNATCAIQMDGELWCTGAVPTRNQENQWVKLGLIEEGAVDWQWRTIALGSGFGLGTAFNPDEPGEVQVVAFAPNSCQLNGAAGPVVIEQPFPFLTSSTLLSARVTAAQANGGHACVHWQIDDSPPPPPRITCWGANGEHQVGPEEPLPGCSTFQDPQILTSEPGSGWRQVVPAASSIVVSKRHTCALDATNHVYCWGANDRNELGPIANPTGVPTSWHSQTFDELATGADHTCGIVAGRASVKCWGENRFGQVGDGTRYHPSPVASSALP